MAIPNVEALIEELDEYGGHLPVRFAYNSDPDPNAEPSQLAPLVITDMEIDGEMTVVILPEQ